MILRNDEIWILLRIRKDVSNPHYNMGYACRVWWQVIIDRRLQEIISTLIPEIPKKLASRSDEQIIKKMKDI